MNILTFDVECDDAAGYGNKTVYPLNPKNKLISVSYKINDGEVFNTYNRNGLPRKFMVNLLDIDLIVGHNIKYDLLYMWGDPELQAYLKRGGKIWDTSVCEYILSAQKWTYPSLDDCARMYGLPLKDEYIKEQLKLGKFISEMDQLRVIDYNSADVENTYQVYVNQIQRIRNEIHRNLIEIYQNHVSVLTEMEWNGLYVDLDIVRNHHTDFGYRLDTLQRDIVEEVNKNWPHEIVPFNPGSTQHWSCYLFGGEIKCTRKVDTGVVYKTGVNKGLPKMKNEDYQLPIQGLGLQPVFKLGEVKEKKAFYSTDEYTLTCLKKESPIVAKQLEWRNLAKMRSTYCQGIIDARNEVTGCVHTNFNCTATTTSRLSSNNPNIQNQPKNLLDFYTSRYDHGAILECDYSQLELRILAFMSQDWQLMTDYETGVDVHKGTASIAFNISIDEVTEDQRNASKSTNYGLGYGGSARGLAEQTGLSVEIVERCMEAFWERYPGTKKYFNDVVTLVNQNKVKTSMTSPQGYYLWESTLKMFNEKEYYFLQKASPQWMQDRNQMTSFTPTEPKNYPMQGMASEIVACAAYEVYMWCTNHPRYRKDFVIVNEIHDALLFDCKESIVEEVKENVLRIMGSVDRVLEVKYNTVINVKFPAAPASGLSWGNIKGY